MNLPNKLTVLRLALVPVFVALLMLPAIPHNSLWALVIFAVASLTDLLDGKIARKRGLVTDFGKLMDPLADKVLVAAAYICMIELGDLSSIAVLVVIAREFAVTSLRLVAAGRGQVLAADIWGKAKTVSQMVTVIGILLLRELSYTGTLPAAFPYGIVVSTAVWITVALTVFSGCNYFWVNRKIFQGQF